MPVNHFWAKTTSLAGIEISLSWCSYAVHRKCGTIRSTRIKVVRMRCPKITHSRGSGRRRIRAELRPLRFPVQRWSKGWRSRCSGRWSASWRTARPKNFPKTRNFRKLEAGKRSGQFRRNKTLEQRWSGSLIISSSGLFFGKAAKLRLNVHVDLCWMLLNFPEVKIYKLIFLSKFHS